MVAMMRGKQNYCLRPGEMAKALTQSTPALFALEYFLLPEKYSFYLLIVLHPALDSNFLNHYHLMDAQVEVVDCRVLRLLVFSLHMDASQSASLHRFGITPLLAITLPP